MLYLQGTRPKITSYSYCCCTYCYAGALYQVRTSIPVYNSTSRLYVGRLALFRNPQGRYRSRDCNKSWCTACTAWYPRSRAGGARREQGGCTAVDPGSKHCSRRYPQGMRVCCRAFKPATFTRRLSFLPPFLTRSLALSLWLAFSLYVPLSSDISCIPCLSLANTSLTGLPLSLSLWLSILPRAWQLRCSTEPALLPSARHSKSQTPPTSHGSLQPSEA